MDKKLKKYKIIYILICSTVLFIILFLLILSIYNFKIYKYYSKQYKKNIDIKNVNIDETVLNNDNVEVLKKIPDISDKIAKEIIKFREKNGNFVYLEDIMYVKGIGQKKYEKIKNNIVKNGN